MTIDPNDLDRLIHALESIANETSSIGLLRKDVQQLSNELADIRLHLANTALIHDKLVGIERELGSYGSITDAIRSQGG